MLAIKDEIVAHAFAKDNREKLKKDDLCGCFHCLTIFHPNLIEDWNLKGGNTAFCPYCSIDSIIGKYAGYPITKEFLLSMSKYWFDCEE
jgi:hypothetical protein